MKAAVYYGPGDMRIEERPVPNPGINGALLKVKACGVCSFVDYESWERYDHLSVGKIRGHEWSAEIVELGSNVKDYKVGDMVYMEPVFKPCYHCEACLQKDYWRCFNVMESGLIDGAFAEYTVLPFLAKDGTYKLPDDISYRDMALIEPLGLSVGVALKAQPEDTVLVLGQHLVGLGITAYLKKMGIKKVITGSISKKHCKASEEVGADVVVNLIDEDVVRVVMRETGGRGVDQVMLTDPRPNALFEAMGSVHHGGIVWLTYYGFPIKLNGPQGQAARYAVGLDYHGQIQPPLAFDPALMYMRTAWGSLGLRAPRFDAAIEMMRSGVITAEKYVTHIYPLEKTKEAFDKAMDIHETIEVMVDLNP